MTFLYRFDIYKGDFNTFVEQTTREMQTRYTIKQSPYEGGKTELLNAFRERLRAYQAVRPTIDQQKVAEKYYALTDEEEKHLWKRLTKTAEREAENDLYIIHTLIIPSTPPHFSIEDTRMRR